MEDIVTEQININNVQSVRNQIMNKERSRLYLATSGDASQIITDYDVFPYPRWYRGSVYNSTPSIAEREAGFRIQHKSCYEPEPNVDTEQPNICFQLPCSTVLPCSCHSNSFKKSREHEKYFNDLCIVKNR